MPAFATRALPYQMNTGFYQYTQFDPNATVGVVFAAAYGAGPIAWTTTLIDTASRADLDGRMWEMDVTRKDGTSTTIGPANAGEFKSYNLSSIYGIAAVMYEWRRVAVPSAEENDRLWVRVLVTETPLTTTQGDRGPKFRFWYGRERGESVTIDAMKCPVLWVKSPAEPRGIEDNFEASKRARILMPQVSPNFNGQVGSNANFYVHAAVPVTKTVTGPNLQHLQLFAVCNANNDAGAKYLYALMGYTQDTVGWHKAYHYQGYHHVASSSAFAKFAPVYYPRFGKAFSRGKIENQLIPESLYGNTGASPYPFYMWLSYTDNDYYYETACFEYREWYRSAVNPPRLNTDPNRGSHAKTGGLWYGTIQIVNKTSYQQAQFYDRCLSIMRDWMSLLDSTEHKAADYCVWHQQSTGKDFALHMPGPFGDGQYSDEWVRVAAQSKIYGIRPSSYSMSEAWTPLTARWNEVMTGQFLICKRNGTTDYGFQIADPAVRTALVNGYSMLAAKSGCHSFYMDLGSGSGATPSYSTPGENAGYYGIVPRHGNYEHTAAKIDMLQRIRVNTKAGDPHNIIASESCEEALGPYLDVTQDGYNVVPETLNFAEWDIYNPVAYPGVPDVSLNDYSSSTRQMAPPLWTLVHNEWSPVGRFACMPINIGLATNTVYHPDGGFTGVTATELVEIHCMMAGHLFASGVRQLFDFDTGNDFPLVEMRNGTVRSHPTYDPSDAGGRIFAFYKTLFQALTPTFAGRVLIGTKVAPRPNNNGITARPNPCTALTKISPKAWRAFPYLYDAGTWVSATSPATWDVVPSMTSMTRSFLVADIIHKAYYDDAGDLWFMIVNWTVDAGLINVSIYPHRYFTPNPGDFNVSELALDGTLTPLGTLGATPGNWQIGNFGPLAIDVGTIPAHSVRIFKMARP